jgi:hypothetical protein
MQNRRGDCTIGVGNTTSSPNEASVMFGLAEIPTHIFLSLLVFA